MGAVLLFAAAACKPKTKNETLGKAAEAVMTFAADATIYKADIAASAVKWAARQVTHGHNGTVAISAGQLAFDKAGKLAGGSLELDMTSIKELTLTDPEKNAKLIRHLKSPDFFDAGKHPKGVLTLTSATSTGGDNYTLAANLTLKGISHNITFPATISKTDTKVTANAKLKINRTWWTVNFRSGSLFQKLGDKMIYDDIELEINAVLTK